MQLKDILTDVATACASRWPQLETATQKRMHIETLVAQLEALKPALKQIKQEKQECARRFGKAKADNLDIAPLRQQMQEISARHDQLEAQRKQIESELLNLFVEDVDNQQLPQQFTHYHRKSSAPITVREITDDERTLWDAYVETHPGASLYHNYRWRDVIVHSFGHASSYLIAQNADETICGVLPLIRLRSQLFGDFAASMPFFNYGGPLTDNDEAAIALLEMAASHAQNNHIGHLEIRSTHKLNEWPCRTDKVSMIRRLPNTIEALDEELGAKVRAQIKRGQNENPQVSIGGVELLDDFYRVFSINMRDLGTPVYSKQFFRNILTMLPGNAHLVTLKLRGKAVAVAFLLGHRDLMEIPWASTLRSVNALNMNMVLYHSVLGFCIKRNFRFFDFGRSTHNSGTFKFKKQWGAEPLQHYWHYWLAEGGALPELKPDSPKFKLLVACWQRLPVAMSRLIGPHIVKYLP
jgi:serine/alanine adding enzyme